MQANKILNKIWSFPHNNSEITQWLAARGIIVVHASCVVVDTNCYILLGNSGAGKTTLAQFFYSRFGQGTVLNDDLIAIQSAKDKIIVYGTPWVGKKTRAEEKMIKRMCHKVWVSSSTYAFKWFSICQRKRNCLLAELKGANKFQVLMHGIWGNHIFIKQDQIDIQTQQALAKYLTKKELFAYYQCLKICLALAKIIKICRLGFKKADTVVDFLIKV